MIDYLLTVLIIVNRVALIHLGNFQLTENGVYSTAEVVSWTDTNPELLYPLVV